MIMPNSEKIKVNANNSISNGNIFDNPIIKKVLPYIKRSIIKTVSFESTATENIKRFLYENCKYTSLSDDYIAATYLPVGHNGNKDFVHYIVPDGSVIFYYKAAPILFITNRYDSNAKIAFIKGTVNVKYLVNDAIKYKNDNTTNETSYVKYNRFNIYELIGANKLNYKQSIKRATNIDELPDEPSDGSVAERNAAFYKTDKLLNYNHSDINLKSAKNPFDRLYYSKNIMDTVDYINEWLKRKNWLLSRGLPWKRGLLLHGPGGTGKSSFAKAVAELFGIPIYHFYLQTMDDQEFKQFWKRAVNNTPCIILLEDFDNVFDKRMPVNKDNNLSFDTVLNTISGIQDANGILLMITTNHIDKIDEAIGIESSAANGISTRPGRIDKIIYFGEMDDDSRLRLISSILNGWDCLINEAFESTKNYTGAQVQEYCIQKALIKLHEESAIE